MEVIVLAAGKGTRMNSALPKVLQPLAGRPMLAHVLDTARQLGSTRICVVYGHGGEVVRERLDAPDLAWALQEPQLGTGHAAQQALPQLADDGIALVLYGDVPLIGQATLGRLVAAAGERRLALLTVELIDPTGYGRIIRDGHGRVQRIVEQKDASADELQVREVNTGILVAPIARLRGWLSQLSNDNAQGEYYLTDIIGMAVADDVEVVAERPDHVSETLGVNNKAQLAELERIHQRDIAARLMAGGVTLLDPARIDVRGTLNCGRDVEIDVNCVFEGEVTLADGVRIGAHCVVRNARLGAGTRLAPFSHVEDTVTGEACVIGPYARTRPGTELADDVHLGNFVEVKNSKVASHSKANHLAYVGDADVGERVNIGAGTITCNYDGVNKSLTEVGPGAFVGSNSSLVAPVKIGAGAYVASGSVITTDVPADAVAFGRARQENREGRAVELRARQAAKKKK